MRPCWLLFSAYALFGLGFGLVNAPITNPAVTGMPRAQAGVAAGIASTGRQVGSTLGVAVVGTILANGSRTAGWWVLASCGALVLAVGALTTGRRARATAERAMAPFAAERPAGAARP